MEAEGYEKKARDLELRGLHEKDEEQRDRPKITRLK